MTTPAHALDIGTHLPSEEVARVAQELTDAIRAGMGEDNVVRLFVSDSRDGEQTPVVLEPYLAQLMLQILAHIKQGEGVTFVPISKRMTTQQAADILNVSRPYLIKLLDEKNIPYELIGRHRRILAKDLFAYKRSRDEQRAEALSIMADEDSELY